MNRTLKKFRVEAGMTQRALAEAIGVSQPNYHRWETDKDPIPEDKLEKLAKVLETTPEAIIGKPPPRRAAFYDDSAPEDLQYYGEVAIHFVNGGKPLLLSISEAAHSQLYRDLQGKQFFFTIKTLSNQYVIIRTTAISDLYFSGEAYDDFGPEHDREASDPKGYDLDAQLPDDRDWEIIECLASDGYGLDEFDEADVKRVSEMVTDYTDEEYQKLVADGLIKLEDLEIERAKNKADIQRSFDLATNMHYRLSTGEERKVFLMFESKLYETFEDLIELNELIEPDEMIRFPVEGYYRTIFINKHAVDYISIPAHQFAKARTEHLAKQIDAFDEIMSKQKTEPTTKTTNKKKIRKKKA